jgi:hypothetical protein
MLRQVKVILRKPGRCCNMHEKRFSGFSVSLAPRPSPASLLSKSGLAEIAAKDGLRSIDFSSCEQFQPGPFSYMGWSTGIDIPLFHRSEDHE